MGISRAVSRVSTLDVVLSDGGTVLSTGVKLDLKLDFASTILSVSLVADAVGDVVVDIWKTSFPTIPSSSGDSITAAAKPTLTADLTYDDQVLTGWDKAVAAGDVLTFNVDSAATVTRVLVAIRLLRS